MEHPPRQRLTAGPPVAGVWAHPSERRGDDPRRDRRDRGRDVPGEDPDDHRRRSPRTVSVDAGPARLHREEELDEEAAPGDSAVVGQAAAGSDALPPGGVLRAATLRPLPRLPGGTWLSQRTPP